MKGHGPGLILACVLGMECCWRWGLALAVASGLSPGGGLGGRRTRHSKRNSNSDRDRGVIHLAHPPSFSMPAGPLFWTRAVHMALYPAGTVPWRLSSPGTYLDPYLPYCVSSGGKRAAQQASKQAEQSQHEPEQQRFLVLELFFFLPHQASLGFPQKAIVRPAALLAALLAACGLPMT